MIDTHTAIWYLTEPHNLSIAAENAINNAEANGVIFVSAMTIIEVIYLIDKGKIPIDVLIVLRDALDDAATAFEFVEISRPIADAVESVSRGIVPDLPDRVIAATALHLGLPLVTKDNQIRLLTTIQTIW